MPRTLEPSEFFGAELRFLTTAEGGRKTSIFSHPGAALSLWHRYRSIRETSQLSSLSFGVASEDLRISIRGRSLNGEGPTQVAVGKILLKESKACVNPDAK
jgi:hypothetical protein